MIHTAPLGQTGALGNKLDYQGMKGAKIEHRKYVTIMSRHEQGIFAQGKNVTETNFIFCNVILEKFQDFWDIL